jgi:uncharacterized membrane protein
MARPEDMVKYRELVPDAPERIFRMAESRTVDASKRLDRLVDAEITQARSDRAMASLFLLIFTVASIVFFSLGNPIAGGVMLGIPVLAVIRTMWTSTIGQRHDKQEKTEGGSGAS